MVGATLICSINHSNKMKKIITLLVFALLVNVTRCTLLNEIYKTIIKISFLIY